MKPSIFWAISIFPRHFGQPHTAMWKKKGPKQTATWKFNQWWETQWGFPHGFMENHHLPMGPTGGTVLEARAGGAAVSGARPGRKNDERI